MSDGGGTAGSGETRPTFFAFAVAFTAAIGGFLFGFDLAVIGAANLYLKDAFDLTESQLGFATASAVIGCIWGPFLGGWMCDAVGRKKTMIAASLLLAASALVTALARDLFTFNLFRIVGGVGVGLCSVASPMFISESAPPRKRGGLGTMYQLAIVFGSVAAPFTAYLILRWIPESQHTTLAWRWMFGSENIAVLVFVMFLLGLPPSPRWLAEKERFDEALRVLEKIDGPDYARAELEAIKTSLEGEKGAFSELFQPGIRYALLIGFLLAFFNNWTGWSGIGGYIPMLFERSGLDDRTQAVLQFALSYFFMGLVTLVACFLVDRLGRRPLWISGASLMAVVTALTGLVFHFGISGPVVLLVIVLCTIPHGLALGPLPWLMVSELFPTRLRAKAVSLITTFLWITIFTTAYLFPLLASTSEELIGSVGGAFWVFTVVCLFAFLFGWKMLPETKGRTLEEIAASWKRSGPKVGDESAETGKGIAGC